MDSKDSGIVGPMADTNNFLIPSPCDLVPKVGPGDSCSCVLAQSNNRIWTDVIGAVIYLACDDVTICVYGARGHPNIYSALSLCGLSFVILTKFI